MKSSIKYPRLVEYMAIVCTGNKEYQYLLKVLLFLNIIGNMGPLPKPVVSLKVSEGYIIMGGKV